MHIAFIDIVTAYAADRPDNDAPLGGTTSAVCFLAREMVKAGISCTLFNKIREPATQHGVLALPFERLIDERSNPKYTAFVFCGRWVEWLVLSVREATQKPLIAWMHESCFGPTLVPALEAFDGAAYVSEWQKRINGNAAKPHWKQTVLRNAMNPRAHNLFPEGSSVLEAKTEPPVLLYVGATPRGAFHIPPLLDHLRPKLGDFTVKIFCDCTPTRDAAANEAYIAWMRGLPNVAHVGMVGQTELLAHMRGAAVLLSPNTWPETSCIALIEAMAAGLSVVTTNRAALPETAAGFACHVAVDTPDDPVRFDMPLPYEAFADAVARTLIDLKADRDGSEKRLRNQVSTFDAAYQWSDRVKPWTDYLKLFDAEPKSG